MNAIGNMTQEKLTGNIMHGHRHVDIPYIFEQRPMPL